MLYDAGFLRLRKEGLWAYYSIDKATIEDHTSLFLKAVEAGLKDNPVAVEDGKSLEEAERLGPSCCSSTPTVPGERR
jgi:hypothetical protein